MTRLLETLLTFTFLLFIFIWGSILTLSMERDIMEAVVISDTPEGCYERKKGKEIWIECPEVTRRVGRSRKLDYYNYKMARSGYLKMKTWDMED